MRYYGKCFRSHGRYFRSCGETSSWTAGYQPWFLSMWVFLWSYLDFHGVWSLDLMSKNFKKREGETHTFRAYTWKPAPGKSNRQKLFPLKRKSYRFNKKKAYGKICSHLEHQSVMLWVCMRKYGSTTLILIPAMTFGSDILGLCWSYKLIVQSRFGKWQYMSCLFL